MSKDELRPCIVEVGEETVTTQFANSEPTTKVLREAEIHNGYFHRWIDESMLSGCESITTCYGIVEFDDGTVHKVMPDCITFTDRN